MKPIKFNYTGYYTSHLALFIAFRQSARKQGWTNEEIYDLTMMAKEHDFKEDVIDSLILDYSE